VGVTDDNGWYRTCGVPLDTPLRAIATPKGSSVNQVAGRLWLDRTPLPSEARRDRLQGRRILRLDLKRPGG